MAKIVFPANNVLFSGCFPEHVEAAKQWVADKGYTNQDVRIYKQTFKYTRDNKEYSHTSVLVETLRPIAVDCGTIKEEK